MATWDSKVLHHDSSLWSLKSSTSTDGATLPAPTNISKPPPPLLSKSFFDAFSRNSNDSSIKATSSDNKLPSPLGDERAQHPSFAAMETAAAGLCKSETVDSHCVAVTTSTKPLHGGLLNASASLGGGSTKVTKKRARASRKPPTTVLEADSANFRAMVQQLTGIPAVPFMAPPPPGRGGLEFLNLVRPSPGRSLLGFGAAAAAAGLSPLGNNAPYHFPLVPRPPSDGGFAPSPFLKGSYAGGSVSQEHTRPSSMGDFLRTPVEELGLEQSKEQQLQSQGKLATSCISMPLLWDGDIREGDAQMDDMKFKIEKSEPEEADHEGSNRLSIVDSWLSHADQGNTEGRST